jgi:hypothetical protein
MRSFAQLRRVHCLLKSLKKSSATHQQSALAQIFCYPQSKAWVSSHNSAFPRILHAVFLAYLNSKPTNVFYCKSKTTCCKRTILWWSCLQNLQASYFIWDPSQLSQSWSVLRGILHIFNEAAMSFFVDRCALTPLNFSSWSKKNTVRFLDQNSGI